MGISKSTRADVIARDGNQCQWCGRYVDTAGGWYSLQHRRARGMGGSRRTETDAPANLLLVCGTGTTECHGHIEAHPREAAARGFRLEQGADPEATPYRDPAGNRWTLDNQAGKNIAITAAHA